MNSIGSDIAAAHHLCVSSSVFPCTDTARNFSADGCKQKFSGGFGHMRSPVYKAAKSKTGVRLPCSFTYHPPWPMSLALAFRQFNMSHNDVNVREGRVNVTKLSGMCARRMVDASSSYLVCLARQRCCDLLSNCSRLTLGMQCRAVRMLPLDTVPKQFAHPRTLGGMQRRPSSR